MGWINDITLDDIASERMRQVADVIGLSDAIILITKMGGIDLYIPSSGKKIFERNYINDRFTGNNISSISVHLGINRSKIETIIKKGLVCHGENNSILSNKIMDIVAERCGYSIAEKLILNFPGERLLVPKNAFGDFKKRYVEKYFTGNNILELALYLEVSEIFVRRTVSEMYYKKQVISLFDPA